LPRCYVEGVDVQRWDFEQKMWSYLRGEWREGGWWYYYLYACVIKVPLGTWLLGLLALYISVRDLWRGRKHRRPTLVLKEKEARSCSSVSWIDEVVLLAPAVAVFVLVSSQTGFNHHLRYVLPAFPFLLIWVSKVGRVFERGKDEGRNSNEPTETLTTTHSRNEIGRRWRRWLMRGAVAGGLSWSIVSSLSIYPHSLSYFNELVGGPKRGHWHLGNSNIDWGQDLLHLRDWYQEHPEARPLHLAYDLPFVDPKIVKIDYEEVPSGPVMNRPRAPKTYNWPWGESTLDSEIPRVDKRALAPQSIGPSPGWYILSVNQIHRLEGDYEYFLEFEPIDWIGYSMLVFHISVDEANRVRNKLGLPLLNADTGNGTEYGRT
jgi:hypothetical protein